jgi:hypothetical protein
MIITDVRTAFAATILSVAVPSLSFQAKQLVTQVSKGDTRARIAGSTASFAFFAIIRRVRPGHCLRVALEALFYEDLLPDAIT